MKIKSLPTEYRGTTYRSRTEARWAVFFTENDIPFNYEAEGFDMGGTWYLPDFWLPAAKSWFEVKPADPTPIEVRKAKLLAQGSGRLVFVAPGNPRADIGLRVFSPTGREQADWKFAYAHEEGVGFLTNCLWMAEFSVRLNGTINHVGCYGTGPSTELDEAGKHQFGGARKTYDPDDRRIVGMLAGRRVGDK